MNKCLYCGKPVKNKYCDLSCQNKHQNKRKADEKFGEIKKFSVLCKKCGKKFEIEEREKLFPKKKDYYCSRTCANARIHSEETKQNIRKSLKRFNDFINPEKEYICLNCGKSFCSKKIRKFCSVKCSTTWLNKNDSSKARKGGLLSVVSQNRRSKNEILFGDLCISNFNNVRFNEPIFNGWDADIILDDYKLAILWNGNWHYKQIGIKHSLNQVQNRDKIKIKEIINFEYKPYIIQDFGKYNPVFVNIEFEKLKNYLNNFFYLKL